MPIPAVQTCVYCDVWRIRAVLVYRRAFTVRFTAYRTPTAGRLQLNKAAS